MADIKVISREWMVEVRFAVSEAPDTQKEFTSVIIRPCTAIIRFAAGEDQYPRLQRVLLSGFRVNKNGLGVIHGARY